MAQGWYVSVDGKTTGPFSTEQVLEDVKQGKITSNAEVCAVGVTRFRKITDEPELAKAFTAPTTLPQAGVCSTGKCCPMPRAVSALTTFLAGAAWSAGAFFMAFVSQCSSSCTTAPGAIKPVGIGLGVLAALVTLLLTYGIAKKKPRAHCAASAMHLIGAVGAGFIVAKACCPIAAAVLGAHVVGLITTRKAKKQICTTV